MRNSTLFEILKTFSSKEFKQLCDFISSPLFNKNENVIKLFYYIRKFYPYFTSEKLEKRTAFENIYGKKKYNDGYMRINIYRLQKLAEDFLMRRNLSKNEIINRISFAEEILNRKLFKILEREIKGTEKLMEKVQFRDESFFEAKYRFEYLKFIYSERYTPDTSKYRKLYTDAGIFPDHSKPFVIHFLINMLREYRFILNEQLMFRLNYDFEFLNEILAYLNKSRLYEEIPLMKIHYLELMLLKDREDKYYHELKNTLFDEIDNLTWDTKTASLGILASYCSYKILTMPYKFRKEKFKLNKLELMHRLYSITEGGCFDDNIFMDIFQNAIAIKELRWAENFINEYYTLLDSEHKSILYYYGYAELYYNKGEFEKALGSLSRISRLPSLDYKLYIKELTIRIYYELNLPLELFNAIDSFKHFVSSNKLIANERKERFLNFARHTGTLMRLRTKNDIEGLRLFETKLNKLPGFSAKKWVLDKINDLIS